MAGEILPDVNVGEGSSAIFFCLHVRKYVHSKKVLVFHEEMAYHPCNIYSLYKVLSFSVPRAQWTINKIRYNNNSLKSLQS